MCAVFAVHSKALWSIWVVNVFLCLSKHNKVPVKGETGESWDDKHSTGMRGHILQPGQRGPVEEEEEDGESGCFEGSKQNIMRKKERRETGGKKRKKCRVVCWWGIGVRVFPQRLGERWHTHTHTHVQPAHIDVYSWFSFSPVKEKQHPVSDVKQW